MNKQTELIIVNQMITNNLLRNILSMSISDRVEKTSAKASDNLDKITDDMVISNNKFQKLIKE